MSKQPWMSISMEQWKTYVSLHMSVSPPTWNKFLIHQIFILPKYLHPRASPQPTLIYLLSHSFAWYCLCDHIYLETLGVHFGGTPYSFLSFRKRNTQTLVKSKSLFTEGLLCAKHYARCSDTCEDECTRSLSTRQTQNMKNNTWDESTIKGWIKTQL